ncbi:MAG: chemotaxis response regulator protein-glutamate methylesterase [Nitrospira sp.]|jgi:two-component system chemotaxis response regulator CheB|nr:chemotaxis response regulator protein-glutamate methylesterase [Nitrospira sp.]
MGKIRVLTIDDSALMRQVLAELLSKDPAIEVIGSAPDPYVAREKIKALNPDVLTLDVEMPKMDGLTFLEKLMRGRPMPVIMVSSLTEAGCQTTLRALELGAVDFITKPKIDLREGMDNLADDLIAKVKGAATACIRRGSSASGQNGARPAVLSSAMIKTTDMIIAIGSSTGGTEAVKEVLQVLPPNTPPVLITQHMPERFTKTWADRMNQLCRISVKEAEDGDSVLPGHALIAPGNYHMTLVRSGARYSVRINQNEPVNRHRPSVDVMFDSVAQYAGGNAVGVILTGMGGDGARGLLRMKEAGAYTIAQDEASCVVFGMPKEAIKLGAAEIVRPLNEIATTILTHVTRA